MDFGFDFMYQLSGASKFLDGVAIFLAQYVPYLFVVALIAAVLTRNHWRERLSITFFTLFSILISWGVVEKTLNFLWPLDRPFVSRGFEPLISVPADPAFPSGHATLFFTLATVIFLRMSRRWGIIAYACAALIGLARIFVGVHYPADILAGAVIGIIVPILIQAAIPYFRRPAVIDESVHEELPVENEPVSM